MRILTKDWIMIALFSALTALSSAANDRESKGKRNEKR